MLQSTLRKITDANRWLLCLILSIGLTGGNLFAQTTNCSPFSASNGGYGSITFNVQNTNSYPIIITSMSCYIGAGSPAVQILHNPTAIASSSGSTWTQGAIGAGQNGWVSDLNTTLTVVTSGVNTLSSSLSITIPAGATYGFGISANMSVAVPSAANGVTTTSADGVNIIQSPNISFAGSAFPSTPIGHGATFFYGWSGCLTFVLPPCTDPPIPGTVTSTSNPVCPNTNFTLSLTGGTAGTGQTYQWQTSANNVTYANISGATNRTYTTAQTTSNYFRCQVTCGTTVVSTPVLVSVNPTLFPSGTYTINSAQPTGGTNYQTFTDAFNAIKALPCGIAGPVVFNVDPSSGPYNEQVIVPAINNTSSSNTITINGNNRVLTYSATLSTEPSTLELNGTDYMIINNLNINGTGSSYAFACHLWNGANNNSFSGCVFTAIGTSVNMVPFSCSGSKTSVLGFGESGNNNVVTNCTMNKGSYGASFSRYSGVFNTGNKLIGCNILDQSLCGVYVICQDGMEIKYCNIDHLSTNTSNDSFYGIYLWGGTKNILVHGNKISNPFGNYYGSYNASYGIFVSSVAYAGNPNKMYNNLISNMKSRGVITGISAGQYDQVYHNTISLDDTIGGASNTTRGIECSGCDVKNNIVTITRSGSGTKHCLYYTSSPAASERNVLYINSSSGSNYIAYRTQDYATLANWQSTGRDLNSSSVNPAYLSPATNDFTPTNGLVNNIGGALGVMTDINGNTRSALTPDPGAYEFTPTGLDAAISWVSPDSPSAAGSKIITVKITNTLSTTINSLQLSYNAGAGPITETFNGLNIVGGANQNFSFTIPYNLANSVTVTANVLQVNGGSDNVSSNNTVSYFLCLTLNGTYTINSATATGGTNFQTFNAAITALTCGGITGPVIFNVAAGSGPYNEQVIIPSISGSSAVNTITINGNNRTLTYAGTSSIPSTLELNGTDYLIVNNLNMDGTDATNALTCHLWNGANYNTFNNCTFSVVANNIQTSMVPFSISGYQNNATLSPTLTGSGNIVSGCTMKSGGFNVVLYGQYSSPSSGNQIINCNILDANSLGIYCFAQNGAIIKNNIIERLTRTDLWSPFIGIAISDVCRNVLVDGNRIRNPFTTDITKTETFIGINNENPSISGSENKFYNNIISDVNSNGKIYGIKVNGYNKAYHNTIVLNQTASTATDSTCAIYCTSTAGTDIRNNIVTINRGGSGAKYCLFNSALATTSNYNDLFINSTAGANYIAYNASTNYSTLVSWQATGKDVNSVSVDPLYVAPASGNYTPANSSINNVGTNLGVANDILNVTRSTTTPDIGAYEFDACTATITPVGPTTVCSGNVVLNANTGTGLTYQWKSNGTNITGATASSYSATTSGSYTVVVTATGGCSATSSATVVTIGALSAAVTPAGTVTICSGTSTTLSATAGTGYTYKWYRNNVLLSTTTQTFTTGTGGTYKCIVTSGSCTATTNSVVVNVPVTPTATVSYSTPLTFCSPGSVTFTANALSGATYQWENNSIVIPGATAQSYVATTAGAYRVKETKSGCSDYSSTKTVTTATSVTATITTPDPVTQCTGGTVNMSITSPIPGYSYQWKKNNTSITGATTTNYAATTTGSYTVTATAGCGTATSNTIAVTIGSVSAQITPATSATLCTGGTLTLTANTGSGYSYQWKKNTTNITGATASTYTVTTAGSYTVTITAPCGNATSAATVVTQAGTVTASVTPAGSSTVCSGSSITFTANTGTGYTYKWYRNNVLLTSTGQTFTTATAGSYKVEVSISGSCAVQSNTVTLTVINNATPTITAGGPTTFCAGQSVTFTANALTGAAYQWQKNSVNITGATAQTYTATTAGSYRVQETKSGCSKYSSKKTVTVNCRLGTNGEEISSDETENEITMEVYPNPFADKLNVNITSPTTEQTEIKVMDVLGKTMYMQQITTNTAMELSTQLSPGIYMVATIVNGQTKVMRVIKTK